MSRRLGFRFFNAHDFTNVTKETIDFDFGEIFLELTNKSVRFPEWTKVFKEENEKQIEMNLICG
jgi:hypothetical protein